MLISLMIRKVEVDSVSSVFMFIVVVFEMMNRFVVLFSELNIVCCGLMVIELEMVSSMFGLGEKVVSRVML